MNKEPSHSHPFYTLLGYVAILLILLVVALLIGTVVYWFLIVPGVVFSRDTSIKWIGFALNTPAIFWWVIKSSRPRWRNRVFWNTLGAAAFIHVAGFLVIARHVQHWSLFYFFAMYAVELPIILTVVDWTFEKFGKKHHSNRSTAG